MAKPDLQQWKDGETVTPVMMLDRITTPQAYYGRKPYFATRGCKSTTKIPRSGVLLSKGKHTDILWPEDKVSRAGFTVADGGRYLVVPENGVYHLHFQAATFATYVRTQVDMQAVITATGSTGNGAKGDLGIVSSHHSLGNHYHTTMVAVTEYLTKGTRLSTRFFVEAAASATWVVSDTEFDTGFFGFMVCPSGSQGWSQPTPGQPPAAKKWVDGELLNANIMNDQTLKQFQALENLPRTTARGVALSAKGNTDVQVPWSASYANHTGMKLASNMVVVPWDGLYLVAVFGNVKKSAQPYSGAHTVWQLILATSKASKDILYLSQFHNPYVNKETGQLVSDVMFLKAGTRLGAWFWGAHPAATWTSRTDGVREDKRWWNLTVTYLGRG